MKITINSKTLEIPEMIKVTSREQYDSFTSTCVAINKLPTSPEERVKAISNLFHLFAAFYIQPLRDGNYSQEEVFKLSDELKKHKDQETVSLIGQAFCMAAGQYLVALVLNQNLN